MDFDFSVLLENSESIIAGIIAILGFLAVVFLAFGKAKTSNKLKKAAETIEENKEEINKYIDLVEDIIEGIGKAKDAIEPYIKPKDKSKEVDKTLEKHMENSSAEELFREAIKRVKEKK